MTDLLYFEQYQASSLNKIEHRQYILVDVLRIRNWVKLDDGVRSHHGRCGSNTVGRHGWFPRETFGIGHGCHYLHAYRPRGARNQHPKSLWWIYVHGDDGRSVYKVAWNNHFSTYVLAVLVQFPFMNTELYVGAISKAMGGADIAWIVGLVVAAVIYYVPMRKRLKL